ncbi:protein sprouty isoform X2 [Ctenocephalides felis]|uniref:protein sprouty isoform X1 n=2 Tax=Ctenocephalides felis TaxID=7515 RepID=UPI000E6E189D|nr:protein sprouty isoform X1 [Ctenocephalides felis]XP_026468048.1 protein sprouty isoform X2 [Ctenocephalides felis]
MPISAGLLLLAGKNDDGDRVWTTPPLLLSGVRNYRARRSVRYMDRHGGPTAVPPPRPPPKLLPRVHQPRHQQPPATPPRMSGTASNTAVVAPARTTPSPAAAFTLAQPRPENERSLNEYVDAPVARAAATTTHQHNQHATAVTKQPQSINKHSAASVLATAGNGGSPNQPSNTLPIGTNLVSSLTQPIICPACGRCRCEQCAAPRPLPQAWLCGDSCLCSAETVIDYVTCLCCVKALYYHCAKDRELDRDGDGTTCADAPCSCVPHRRVARWGCMVALASVLPCLCLYWPFRGCQSLCAAAYARHSRRRGCRCRSTASSPGAGRDEKRLLDAPTPPPPDSFC